MSDQEMSQMPRGVRGNDMKPETLSDTIAIFAYYLANNFQVIVIGDFGEVTIAVNLIVTNHDYSYDSKGDYQI